MKFLASGSEKRVVIPIIAGVLILLISSLSTTSTGLHLDWNRSTSSRMLIGKCIQGPAKENKIDQNLIYTPIDGTLELVKSKY